MSVSAAVTIAGNRKKKRRKKRPVDIETLRASRSRSTREERARAQEIRRPTPSKRKTTGKPKPSARDVLRAAEQARHTGDFKKAESIAKRAGFSQEGKTVLGRVGEDLAKAIIYTPAGVYELGKAGAKDVGAATQGDLASSARGSSARRSPSRRPQTFGIPFAIRATPCSTLSPLRARISSSPMAGLSISLSCRTSGEPYLSWMIAFMFVSPRLACVTSAALSPRA